MLPHTYSHRCDQHNLFVGCTDVSNKISNRLYINVAAPPTVTDAISTIYLSAALMLVTKLVIDLHISGAF